MSYSLTLYLLSFFSEIIVHLPAPASSSVNLPRVPVSRAPRASSVNLHVHQSAGSTCIQCPTSTCTSQQVPRASDLGPSHQRHLHVPACHQRHLHVPVLSSTPTPRVRMSRYRFTRHRISQGYLGNRIAACWGECGVSRFLKDAKGLTHGTSDERVSEFPDPDTWAPAPTLQEREDRAMYWLNQAMTVSIYIYILPLSVHWFPQQIDDLNPWTSFSYNS